MTPWSDDIEDLMKSWGEKAAGLMWMHERAGGEWKSRSDRLSLLGIGITSVASTLSIVTAGLDDAEFLMYVVGGIGGISTLIQTLKKFYNADDRSAEHTTTSKKFGSFYRSVSVELGMPRDARRPVEVVTEWASKEFNQIQLEAPRIERSILSSFKRVFVGAHNVPDIVEDEFVISVHGRAYSKDTLDPV